MPIGCCTRTFWLIAFANRNPAPTSLRVRRRNKADAPAAMKPRSQSRPLRPHLARPLHPHGHARQSRALPRRSAGRTRLLFQAAVFLAGVASAIGNGIPMAVAQEGAPSHMPLPPARPQASPKASPKASPQNALPPGQPAGAIRQQPTTPGKPPVGPHPIEAPGSLAQRRAIIRHCAMEWRSLQRARLTGGILWRDFSRECMTRQMEQTPPRAR